jgi:hypothetical protein
LGKQSPLQLKIILLQRGQVGLRGSRLLQLRLRLLRPVMRLLLIAPKRLALVTKARLEDRPL